MFKLLTKPYPSDFSLKRISFHAWTAFGIVFFILFFLGPFKMDELAVLKRSSVALSFASVCLFVIYPVEFIPSRLFKSFYREENWSIWKQVFATFLIVIFIAIGNALLAHFILGNPLSFGTFLGFLGYVLIIGVFPITIGIIFTQYSYHKRYLLLAEQANRKFIMQTAVAEQHTTVESSDKEITLKGQNNNEVLTISIHQLMFIEAADNYVEIHYLQNQEKKILFRSTLSLIHEQLSEFDFLIKCHRSFLVNRNFIITSNGNAQGLKLVLRHCDDVIPVSRSLSKLFL
jgi:LytTr DNA-binding domain